ncbi:MAG: hypothetical protein H6707_21215 [Deltaproteobacteria bacterium]|nr:hypothetical protein [Deltaproteobacteria bacterium]
MLFTFGCEGPAGPEGKAGEKGTVGDKGDKGDPGDPGTVDPKVLADIQAKLDEAGNVEIESCAICHAGHGAKKHQDIYKKYMDASKLALFFDSVTATANGDGTFNTTVTFKVTKNGLPFEDVDGLPMLAQKRFYSVQYDATTMKHDGSVSFGSIKAVAGKPGFYTCNAAKAGYDMTAAGFNGLFYGYVGDDELDVEGMALYDNVASMGKAFGTASTTPYKSLANISGCEKCHGKPYMKHGYRAGAVPGLGDFASCKVCHYDTRNGGHRDWQLLADKPSTYAAYDVAAKKAAAAGDTTKNTVGKQMTAEENTKYTYTANVMNDVHMSHAMEFPYPQKISNCATCHAGKLTALLVDDNFTPTTCKSCHAWTGEAKYPTAVPPMEGIWKSRNVDTIHASVTECKSCHNATGSAKGKRLKDLHNGGYDPKIYTADANRWADLFRGTIGATTFDAATNKLTIELSAYEAGGDAANATYDAKDIVPTLMIGLYGYNTKDFIVNAHGNDDKSKRLLEFVLNGKDTNPRLKLVTNSAPNWKAEVDLSMWAQMIKDKVIKRAEISMLPALTKVVNDKDENVGTCSPACSRGNHCDATNKCIANDDVVLALNAPSRTFDLTTNDYDDGFYPDIVDVEKCNKCHDALGTSFHSGNRGGNVRVCRTCHVVSSGGSHLEMQSRSIDSYVHAIHSFQAFDPGDIDFKDPVEKLRYEHHIEHKFPNFTIKNCEACHNPGTYTDPPDNAKSLPGILSGSDKVDGRNIGTVKSYVTGPGARACGACHRAHMINEDKAGKLAAFYQHVKENGFMVENADGVLDKVITTIMTLFN